MLIANVLAVDLAMEYKVDKFIYISSVHAIPEKPENHAITEVTKFCPNDVVGDYAKTKAEATKYVIDAISQGLRGLFTRRELSACMIGNVGRCQPWYACI